MNIRKPVLALLLSGALLTLSACTEAPVKQMPVASPSTSPSASPTKAPSQLLPKDKATKQQPTLLNTTTISKGVTVRAYRVGTGTVVAEQLKSNPVLKDAKIKVGAKLAVIRYTVQNDSGKPVDVITFAFPGVFSGGSGKAALADNGYASAATRLGYATSPLLQFTDRKTGKAGNWSLASGKSANWYTDWVLEKDGVLLQNFILGKKVISNVDIDLLK